MARMRYVVTGGTGFIGRRVVSQLLARDDDAKVWVLVRRESLARFERLAIEWGEGAKPLVGDLTVADLGLTDEAIAELGTVDHVVHCAAIYDITVAEEEQRAANVEGTRAVVALARRLDATLHHVSSIAVAGTYRGEYTEDDFDVAQDLPTPYHQTKFEAELLVRSTQGLRYRVYRPAVVVGDSRTGEMDKVDGPYYFFGLLAKLARLPKFTPMMLPDTGRTNIVPVDFVVEAVVHLMHAEDRDGQTFHLTAPKTIGLRGIYRGVARTAGLPPLRGSLPSSAAAPIVRATGRAKVLRNMVATQLGVPAEILDVVDLFPTFTAENATDALRGTGITVPEFASYAPKLWRYWAEHLDPDRARRDDPAGPLVGKHVIITGASSGIGRASAIAVAERGGCVFALARNAEALDDLVAEIRAAGGQAHAFTCDVTDSTSVEHTVKDILGRFGHVDYLVNNAGRSIRRSVMNSTERLHDYERVMAVNYFGAVRMVLALLPHWRERRFGHVVNVELFGRDAFLNELIWAYDYGGKPKRRWPQKHDTILVYVKDPALYFFDGTEVEREPYMAPGLVTPEQRERGKMPVSVIWHTIVSPTGREKTGYPTQKPQGLVRRFVQASSRPGDLCLDPFAGSGTLGAVARQLDRRYLLIDESPEAVRVMRERIDG